MKSSLSHLLVPAALLLGSAPAAHAQAQAPGRPPHRPLPADSSKVYTYVEKMPAYPGGWAALRADLRREFQAASTAAGCAAPAFPVYVRLVVGPSGYVYAARSINVEEANRRRQGLPTANLPELPAACEAAISTAAHRLLRWQPGQQSGRRVAVEIMVKLLDGSK